MTDDKTKTNATPDRKPPPFTPEDLHPSSPRYEELLQAAEAALRDARRRSPGQKAADHNGEEVRS